MRVVILKHNAGNVLSVTHALRRLGVEPEISDDPQAIAAADKVIFPGVGEASSAIVYLRARGLDQVIVSLKNPVLGICLGLQLLCRKSEEGGAECLGVFPEEVRRFPPGGKIPHMGWNKVYDLRGPLFTGLKEPFMYFVHSYYAPCGAFTCARAEYNLPFSAAMQRENFFAVQFHPEKSGVEGRAILQNFIKL